MTHTQVVRDNAKTNKKTMVIVSWLQDLHHLPTAVVKGFHVTIVLPARLIDSIRSQAHTKQQLPRTVYQLDTPSWTIVVLCVLGTTESALGFDH